MATETKDEHERQGLDWEAYALKKKEAGVLELHDLKTWIGVIRGNALIALQKATLCLEAMLHALVGLEQATELEAEFVRDFDLYLAQSTANCVVSPLDLLDARLYVFIRQREFFPHFQLGADYLRACESMWSWERKVFIAQTQYVEQVTRYKNIMSGVYEITTTRHEFIKHVEKMSRGSFPVKKNNDELWGFRAFVRNIIHRELGDPDMWNLCDDACKFFQMVGCITLDDTSITYKVVDPAKEWVYYEPTLELRPRNEYAWKRNAHMMKCYHDYIIHHVIIEERGNPANQ